MLKYLHTKRFFSSKNKKLMKSNLTERRAQNLKKSFLKKKRKAVQTMNDSQMRLSLSQSWDSSTCIQVYVGQILQLAGLSRQNKNLLLIVGIQAINLFQNIPGLWAEYITGQSAEVNCTRMYLEVIFKSIEWANDLQLASKPI